MYNIIYSRRLTSLRFNKMPQSINWLVIELGKNLSDISGPCPGYWNKSFIAKYLINQYFSKLYISYFTMWWVCHWHIFLWVKHSSFPPTVVSLLKAPPFSFFFLFQMPSRLRSPIFFVPLVDLLANLYYSSILLQRKSTPKLLLHVSDLSTMEMKSSLVKIISMFFAKVGKLLKFKIFFLQCRLNEI